MRPNVPRFNFERLVSLRRSRYGVLPVNKFSFTCWHRLTKKLSVLLKKRKLVNIHFVKRSTADHIKVNQ